MLGDTILAEPGALIGFAGPRVIEQTIGQKLPEGFQQLQKITTGRRSLVARSIMRVSFSPTISPMLPIRNEAAITPIATGMPSSLAPPVMTASSIPVASRGFVEEVLAQRRSEGECEG